MALYKSIKVNAKTRVLVWKIEEDFSFLQDIYINERSVLRLNGMKSEIHQKGFLSVRHLLKEVGYTDDDLFYTNDGKPHLKDGKRISITHSFTFAGIIISDTIVGIDIEKNRPKIVRIADKFIGTEKDFVDYKNIESKSDEYQEDIIKQLTVIWGAKESLYKIHPDGGLLFNKHLPVEKFSLSDGFTKGWIKKDNFYEVYVIHFEFFDGFTLVYAVN